MNDRVSVPPVGGEDKQWAPADPDMLSRREIQRQTGAYTAAIVPSIARWEPDIPSPLQADVDDATSALARLDGLTIGMLGADARADVQVRGPMPTLLLRTESASSSQIEQLTTSALQLALAAIDEPAKANAAAVLGNVHAMELAIGVKGAISVESILEMHRALLIGDRLMAQQAGLLRTQQVWIGPGGSGPLLADFVPPVHERVPAAMDDLVDFIAREDIPVLAQAAIAHAQFETIHPFADGNGRTGRALIHAILKERRLVTSSVIQLSAGLLTDIDSYFAALSAYRSGDAGPIIARFSQAARFASRSGRILMEELTVVVRDLEAKLKGVRRDAAAWKILRLLVSQPVVNLNYIIAALPANHVTALRGLELLTDRGVLREITGRRRHRVWRQPEILEVMDSFGSGLRRVKQRP